MNTPKRQAVSQSMSREGRREATARGRRIRAATDLTHSPDFDLQHGEEWTGGRPCDYYTIQHKGVKAHLRFDYMWKVRCPALGIEENFLNQPPDDLAKAIEDLIDQHLPNPSLSPAARLRQSTPAVRELAQRHTISVAVADEIMLERAS
jgi:hypothetical protein